LFLRRERWVGGGKSAGADRRAGKDGGGKAAPRGAARRVVSRRRTRFDAQHHELKEPVKVGLANPEKRRRDAPRLKDARADVEDAVKVEH
jgi:hypothetical protein